MFGAAEGITLVLGHAPAATRFAQDTLDLMVRQSIGVLSPSRARAEALLSVTERNQPRLVYVPDGKAAH
jgi:hypothetical protein